MKPETKTLWLSELSQFLVEANQETHTAGKGKIKSFLPNHKTHAYKRDPKNIPMILGI